MNKSTLTASQSIVILLTTFTAIVGVGVIIHYLLEDIRNNVFVAEQFFMYFTVQTGLLYAVMQIVYAYAKLGKSSKLQHKHLDLVRYLLTVYAAIILPIYWLVVEPFGTWKFDNWWLVIHLVLPLIAIASWLWVPPVAKVRGWWPVMAIAYPLTFVLISLAIGVRSGWYPYPFLDPSANGMSGVVTWIALLSVGVVLIGALLYAPIRIRQKRNQVRS